MMTMRRSGRPGHPDPRPAFAAPAFPIARRDAPPGRALRALFGALVVATGTLGCAEDTMPPARVAESAAAMSRGAEGNNERYLYVATVSQSTADPDFIAVVGADPRQADFGTIVNRIDMPNVGDELHHFGYSLDRKRLVVPGLFSNRIHVFRIGADRKQLTLSAVNEQVAASSGYAVPHGVIPFSGGRLLAPMVGVANQGTTPGGLVQINDVTGAFESVFGPGPVRDSSDLGPRYMYDFDSRAEFRRGISTTFGPPALCAGGIDPTCLGDEVAVWDIEDRKVIQVESLGAHSGALQVRFIDTPGVRRAFINTPGTSAIWLADDDDNDGRFDFQQVLGPNDGLQLPADMLLSYDARHLYVSNWFGNTVQQFDVSDPYHPVSKGTVAVPHANMLRLSRDNTRLYVTNSLLTPWDNDTDFGGPRNRRYGIWLFHVDPATGRLAPSNDSEKPWVSFASVQKKNTRGPAGPHMMLFDPGVRMSPGEH